MEDSIVIKGDRYAQRMIARNKENTNPSINRVQSLRTKMTVLEALQPSPYKNYVTVHQMNLSYPSGKEIRKIDTIEKENCETAKTKFLKKDSISSKIQYPNFRTSLSGKENHRPKFHENIPSSQGGDPCWSTAGSEYDSQELADEDHFKNYKTRFPRDFYSEKSSEDESCGLPWDEDKIDEKIDEQSRISVGQYFKAKSQIDTLNLYNTPTKRNSEKFSSEFNGRESQKYFGSRVLSVIEPEVVERDRELETPSPNRRRRSDIFVVQETFKVSRLASEQRADTSVILETSHTEESDSNDSDKKWSLERHSVNGKVLRKFGKTVVKDFDEYTTTTTTDDDEQIFETPRRMFVPKEQINNFVELPSVKETFYILATPTPYRSTNSDNGDRTDEMSFLNNPKPIHESTRTSYERPNPASINCTAIMPQQVSEMTSNAEIYESARKCCDEANVTGVDCTLAVTQQASEMTTNAEIYQTACQEDESETLEKSPSVPYEVENFLKTALGSEYQNSAETNATDDKSNSDFNVTELMMSGVESPNYKDNTKDVAGLKSNEMSPLKSEQDKTFIPEESAKSEAKNSSRLDATRKLCRTVTQKLRRSINLLHRQGEIPPTQKTSSNLNPSRKRMIDELLAKSNIEEKRIQQACKAVDICKSSENFVASQERVEAERLLTQISLTKTALMSEIGRIACQDNPQPEDSHKCVRGRIIITDLSVTLHEEQIRSRNEDEAREWFIVAVRSGLFVWVSQAVKCPTSGLAAYFPGEAAIPDLGPDFRITVTVYSAVFDRSAVGRDAKCTTWNSHQFNLHAIKDKIRHRRSGRRMSLQCIEQCKKSSFKPCGTVDLVLADLKLAGPWALNNVPPKSVVHGLLRFKLKCDLQLTERHMGFLTYSSSAFFLSRSDQSSSEGTWNRRWCLLKGQTLQLWNYPDEQESHIPIFTIDLGNCVSEKVSLADRAICARSRTLIIETCWRRNEAGCQEFCSHTRHLLCFDNRQDLAEWQAKLNHVISSLLQWNVVKKSH